MSKGPGWVERTVEKLFRDFEQPFTSRQIAHVIWHAGRDGAVIEKRQIVSARRAAGKVAKRLQWGFTKDKRFFPPPTPQRLRDAIQLSKDVGVSFEAVIDHMGWPMMATMRAIREMEAETEAPKISVSGE